MMQKNRKWFDWLDSSVCWRGKRAQLYVETSVRISVCFSFTDDLYTHDGSIYFIYDDAFAFCFRFAFSLSINSVVSPGFFGSAFISFQHVRVCLCSCSCYVCISFHKKIVYNLPRWKIKITPEVNEWKTSDVAIGWIEVKWTWNSSTTFEKLNAKIIRPFKWHPWGKCLYFNYN